MVLDGRTHTKDLILFHDRTLDGWWRQEGHNLKPADLDEVIASKAARLVVGTGAHGVMKISREAEELLALHGIELIAEPTTQAWQTYNSLAGPGVVGAFHLTC